MRLLVTRPQPDAGLTAEKLRSAGHMALVDPVLTTEFLPAPAAIEAPAAVALTSRNAVRAVAGWARHLQWLHRPAYVVGAATAAAARAAGFVDIRMSQGDGAALAAMIAADPPPDRGAILYPTAPDRSRGLEDHLRAAGIAIVPVLAYRMVPSLRLGATAQAALLSQTLDGVLLYSARTAAVFLSLLRQADLTDALAELTVFVLSVQVAEPLAGISCRSLKIAQRPDEASLFALLDATETPFAPV